MLSTLMKFSLTQTSRYAVHLLAYTTLSLLFTSCESELSDVEITEPGLLRPFFQVGYTMSNDGAVSSYLTTTVFDKENKLFGIELKNGQVKVNGDPMKVTYTTLLKPTYSIPVPNVNLDTEYIFEIVLPDKQRYAAKVKTPPKTFAAITVPSTSSADKDLTISWGDIGVHDDITIAVTINKDSASTKYIDVKKAQVASGSYTIPKSTFAKPRVIFSVMIKVISKIEGTVDSRFTKGSSVIASTSVEKHVVFEN